MKDKRNEAPKKMMITLSLGVGEDQLHTLGTFTSHAKLCRAVEAVCNYIGVNPYIKSNIPERNKQYEMIELHHNKYNGEVIAWLEINRYEVNSIIDIRALNNAKYHIDFNKNHTGDI